MTSDYWLFYYQERKQTSKQTDKQTINKQTNKQTNEKALKYKTERKVVRRRRIRYDPAISSVNNEFPLSFFLGAEFQHIRIQL